MPFISRVGNAIAGVAVPKSVQKVFLATSKDGAAAIAPLEGSVIVGRTVAESMRSGFLGFQERLTEESAAAFIWLWGVRLMQKLFDAVKRLISPKGQHLSGEIAWNLPIRKRTSIDLTPQELFTRDAQEMQKLLQIKSLRWLFSVGVALGGVAYVVPKLNQLKTNWVLKHFYQGKADKVGADSQTPSNTRTDFAPSPDGGHFVPSGIGRTMPMIVSAGTPGSLMSDALQSAVPAETLVSRASSPVVPSIFSVFANSSSSPVPLSNREGHTPPANGGLYVPSGVGRTMSTIVPAGASFPAEPEASRSAAPALPVQPLFNGSRSNSLLSAAQTPSTTQQPVRFGGNSLGNLIQNLGYAVEHTSYGSILVVDNGIVVGRAYVANQRSKFEAVEVVFRDVVSLYFYILFAPHVMNLLSKGLNPLFNAHIQLQPKVAEALTQTMSRELAERTRQWMASEPDPRKRLAMQAAFQQGAVPKDFVLDLLKGSRNPLLQQSMAPLKTRLRQAPLAGENGVIALLQKELAAYGLNPEQVGRAVSAVQASLGQSATVPELDRLIAAIQQQKDARFAHLGAPQRKELVVALKNAFRHSAGLEVTWNEGRPKLNGQALRQSEIFGGIWDQLSSTEQQHIQKQLRQLAQVDALDQASTMWRRSLNLLRGALGENSSRINQAEMLGGWLEEAVSRHLPLGELLEEELASLRGPLVERGILSVDEALTPEKLREVPYLLQVQRGRGLRKLSQQVERLNGLLGGATSSRSLEAQVVERMDALFGEMLQAATPETTARPLLEQYQRMIRERLMGERGQLFSLALLESSPELDVKLKNLLVGGLENDIRFLKRAQDVIGDLVTDPRNLRNLSKFNQLRTSMTQYGDKLLNRLEQEPVQTASQLPKLLQWGGTADLFHRLNQNLNYVARTISMVGAMLCLGILVPKMQYLITRQLTGRDENPGISSAERSLGIRQ